MLRDEIIKILSRSETEDIDPPYRCLPVRSKEWCEMKADAIMALKVTMKCPDEQTCFEKGCVSWSEPCKGFITKTLAELEVSE